MSQVLQSYAAASIFPSKVVKKAGVFYKFGKLYPHHPQISLTNKCNLSCDFCSCSDRQDDLEIDFVAEDSQGIIQRGDHGIDHVSASDYDFTGQDAQKDGPRGCGAAGGGGGG